MQETIEQMLLSGNFSSAQQGWLRAMKDDLDSGRMGMIVKHLLRQVAHDATCDDCTNVLGPVDSNVFCMAMHHFGGSFASLFIRTV